MKADAKHPRVWGFLGHRAGDNNQLLALCEGLGLPFETRTLAYNWMRRLEGFHPRGFVSLEASSRRWLQPPWPDLVVTVGRRSVPIAREVKARSGSTTKLVLIGHPRVDPSDFDLIITTRQYPLPQHRNVLLLPLALSRCIKAPAADADEQQWLDRLPQPHLLMAVGGSTKYHDVLPASTAAAASKLAARAQGFGGTVIAIGSPRSDPAVLRAIEAALDGTPHVLVGDQRPRFPVLMNDASEIFVTADSMSMISEAVLSGKPVGLIPVTPNRTGRRWLGEPGRRGLGRGKRRDMSRIWEDLQQRGLVGTIDAPAKGDVENPTEAAAIRVRQLLGL